MPIKTLEPYLFERKQVFQALIDILANATLGIDVEYYLNKIYTQKKEQFLAAIGGAPTSLRDYIKSDLKHFQSYNIRPIFVIPGLKTATQLDDAGKVEELVQYEKNIENVWNKLMNPPLHDGVPNLQAMENFRTYTEKFSLDSIVNDLIKCFIELGIDYLVTPYDTSFQLSYLLQSQAIDAIYGSTDVLLSKVDKLIIGMDFQSKEFKFVDKRKLLQEIGLNERQFVDLSLMVGCALQPHTFPIFPPQPRHVPGQPYPILNYFKLGLDMVFQYISFSGVTSDFYGYILNFNDPKLVDLYVRGQCAIKYVPVLTANGYVELYNVQMAQLGFKTDIDYLADDDDNEEDANDGLKEREEEPGKETGKETESDKGKVVGNISKKESVKQGGKEKSTRIVKVPTNLHEVISQRLPPELYLYQSLGLLPVEFLTSIARGVNKVGAPPELLGQNNDSYQKLISSKFYLDILDYQYNLITQLVARYYQVKKIAVKFWFKKDTIELNNRITPPIGKKVEKLFVNNAESNDLFSLSRFFIKPAGTNEYNKNREVKHIGDIVSTGLLRTLYLYGLANEKGELSALGKIIQEFAATNQIEREDQEKELESLIYLALLLKTKTFKLNALEPANSGLSKVYTQVQLPNSASSTLTAEEEKCISLISRVFSLQKLSTTAINYHGPVSRGLLSFRTHVEFIRTTLLHTLECLLIDFIVRLESNNIKATYENKQDWLKLIDQLPFYSSSNNTLMGVFAEIFFKVAIKQQRGADAKASEAADFAKVYLADHVLHCEVAGHNVNYKGEQTFSQTQLNNDFKKGVKWWKSFYSFMTLINEKEKLICDDTLFKDIKGADTLLSQYV